VNNLLNESCHVPVSSISATPHCPLSCHS